jgi:short subunit dehydrogenase-like uncharacterized protein
MILYGANGYTGKLIANLAFQKGINLTLAGRNEEAIKKLAQRLNFPYEIVDLNQTDRLIEILKPHEVVIHCAGPFQYTSKQMIEACLKSKTHYLDITGEFSVFEDAYSKDLDAKRSEIMLMPGVGFDVVPSDCLSVFLKENLPDATQLTIAFNTKGGMSRGTALTSLQKIGEPGAIRKNGKILSVPQAFSVKTFPFREKVLTCMTIPWGDLFTAFHSTGIPNIQTFMSFPAKRIKWVRFSNYIGFLLSQNWVKNYFANKIKNRSKIGPDENDRQTGYSIFYGEVKNDKGATFKTELFTPEAYRLTSETALLIAQKVANKNYKTGYQTPAMVYGAYLILEIAGVERKVLK